VKGEKPKQKRQPFTDRERKLVRLYFKKNIETKITLSLDKCRKFLALNNVNHTAKITSDNIDETHCWTLHRTYKFNQTR